MSLDFSNFEAGDDIEIHYTVYQTLGSEGETKETTVATTVDGKNSVGNLEWKAGSTGIGVIRDNGHVFDGNGIKVGVDATVEHLED